MIRALLIALLIGAAVAARAEEGQLLPADMPASYPVECDGCHVPFPPSLLPVGSWRRIMDDLADHYGVDARLSAPTRDEIADFLDRNAGRFRRFSKRNDPLRLTATLWFNRSHGRVKAMFRDPQVGGRANCTACHARAEDGRYDEYTLLARQYTQRN